MQMQVVSGYEPTEIFIFRNAQEKLMPLLRCSLTESMYILNMCEYLDGDMTFDASRFGNGIIRIHRVAIDMFTITEDAEESLCHAMVAGRKAGWLICHCLLRYALSRKRERK